MRKWRLGLEGFIWAALAAAALAVAVLALPWSQAGRIGALSLAAASCALGLAAVSRSRSDRARWQDRLDAERQFASLAAHELRTPLAAAKIHAQVVQHAGAREAQLAALDGLVGALDQATHLVDQLLALARADLAPGLPEQRLALDALARQVVSDLAPIAARRSQRLVADRLEPAAVDGTSAPLVALLRNLLDNAMRHGPEGGHIRVTTGLEDGAGFLRVEDAGPGIPPEEHERVFERFVRLPSSQAVDGSGIGLSIVAAVARRHRARIALGRSDLGGLRVDLRFPAARIESADRG